MELGRPREAGLKKDGPRRKGINVYRRGKGWFQTDSNFMGRKMIIVKCVC